MTLGNYRTNFDLYHAQQATYVTYAIQTIMYVVSAVGPRAPGSVAEMNSQKIMMADLRNYCDTVTQEPFTFHPKAFMGFICIDSFLMIASVFLYNFKFRILSFICTTISCILFFGEFFMYRELCDPIFESGSSSNIIGVIKPVGEVKRVAIFNGHTDSMWQWQFNYLGGGHLLVLVIVFTVGGMLVFELLQIFYFKEFQNWIAILQICWLPWYLLIGYFTNFKTCVEGANDNLTGCVTAMAVAKYLKDNNIRLQNTEVRIVLTGCEEAGLRGAKRYAAAHPVASENAEVAFFCFDTIRDLDSMAVYNKDMTGTVSHDMRVCNIMKRAGELGGLDLPFATVFCGSTDAAAMTQAGFPAGSFAALNPTPADYYHTVRDNIQNLEPIALGHSIDVAMGSLFIFDEEGLDGSQSDYNDI
ncbi:putative aminopeptidase [Tritrichomonas foetus]|uniref:Carboxypeptidase Q n=1 Tax=Tritrichomonas foetus TaxID=1144522 RepID=A0A1J4K330_9EUKA|nr:putative aminopeptidase [Tritrichomonas foetus]|eukprot:OHT05378.1 putative aminopeptidase [Tritrichomonas foetus]